MSVPSQVGRSLVLVIEDDAIVARGIARALAGLEVEIVVAATIRQIDRALGERRPCIVLVDAMVKGVERWLREAPHDGWSIITVPLRLVPAREDAERTMVKEPLHLEMLREVVEQQCRPRERRLRKLP